MFNVQLCLTFERVSVTLKFPLCSAIITIVQKSTVYGYGYYSYKVLSLVQWAVALLELVQYFPVFLKYFPLSCLAVYSLLNVQNNSKSNTNIWEST